jgi:hypothetical protein
MADSQDTLLEEFQQIHGAVVDSTEAWSSAGGQGGVSGGQKDTAPRGDVDSLGDQTGKIDYGSSSSSSSSNSSGGLLSGLGGALAAGLGIVPLGLEIASLFGGGPSTPPPLTRYAMPDSIGFVGSTDDSGAQTGADFGQTGQPRSYGTPSTLDSLGQPAPGATPSSQDSFGQPAFGATQSSQGSLGQPASGATPSSQDSFGQPASYPTPSSQYSTSTTPAQSAPSGAGSSQSQPGSQNQSGSQSQPFQITVQAMDAQSFMDRSDDIAAAVNKALLSLHPLSDTISNL